MILPEKGDVFPKPFLFARKKKRFWTPKKNAQGGLAPLEPLGPHWGCGNKPRREQPMSPAATPAGSALTSAVRVLLCAARWSASPGAGAPCGGSAVSRRRTAHTFHPHQGALTEEHSKSDIRDLAAAALEVQSIPITPAPIREEPALSSSPSAFSLGSKTRFFWQDKRNGF